MNYEMIKEVLEFVEEFEIQNQNGVVYSNNMEGFKHWIADSMDASEMRTEPTWEGKEKGRSPESVINTLIVHMNRYAKSYSKSVIYNSDFSTQEDFIYLINLKAFGAMTKIELIKKNIQEKSVGVQIINRLIRQGWVDQTDSEVDKRSKLVSINKKGIQALERLMGKVRDASEIVTGNLTYQEKMQLIRLLKKLNEFHHPVYLRNLEPTELLEEAMEEMKKN